MRHGQRSRIQLAVMWSVSLLIFPLLLAQGVRVRKTALRLPEGAPPNEGQKGDQAHSAKKKPLRIVGVGDSVIAGVGLETMSESLTAQVAERYHEATGRSVSWLAQGVNGENLGQVLERIPLVPRADLYLVSVGVNDVTSLTGLLRWQLQVTELMSHLRRKSNAHIVLMGVPPMEFFHALPQPLRWVLGIRAALLDKTLEQVAELLDSTTWVNSAMKFDADHLAEDGYHPNAEACLEIATQIVDAVPLQREEVIV